nr:MAG TPA_asm: hypothetical protein [Caudoviricetes sp.]
MATITLHPSQVVAEESTYDSVSADAPLTKPIGKGATNTTYAEIYLVRGRQAQTYVTYRFNTSSIPAGATIKKVTLRAKGDVSSENTYVISITQVSLLSGQDVLVGSNDYAFGEMASTVAVIATNVTRAQLDDTKAKLFVQRGSGYTNDQEFMRFYGADLIVEYEAGTTPPDPEPEPEPTPTDKMHAVLIDGTTYNVQGGRALVNGTGVDIKGGRALVNGAGVDILFKPETHIYGVEWDWTSSGATRGTRTDDAVKFGEPNPAVNNGSGSSPFDGLMPWAGMVRENRAGGVEVKEPKYWFKWTKTGKKLKLQIADGPVDGFSIDPVNRDRGDGLGELNYSYIGRYHCASDYKSTTGTAQKVGMIKNAARANIHKLGANFWQMDFAQYWYVNMLFLVEFADWNGERIGMGCSSDGSKMNNGQTDAMGYHTGTTAASRDSYGFTQYRNIEGWWDNVFDWIDGCYYNSNGLNIISNPNKFNDNVNGTPVGKPSSGYPSDFTIPTASDLEWALYPSEANGRVNTYAPDYWHFRDNYPALRHGGYYYQVQGHGPFCVDYSSTSASNNATGCRLQERPPKT